MKPDMLQSLTDLMQTFLDEMKAGQPLTPEQMAERTVTVLREVSGEIGRQMTTGNKEGG